METEEWLRKRIKKVYTAIVVRLIDKEFRFPEGGRSDIQLDNFVKRLKGIYGEASPSRIVDYCVFQTYKNRDFQHQRPLAVNVFGQTSMGKYLEWTNKGRSYFENQWLKDGGLTREYLCSLISYEAKAHPLAKYIYMASEENTKKRCKNPDVRLAICSASTLMWSPMSPTCQECESAGECKALTEKKYPELYRIRIERYGESDK